MGGEMVNNRNKKIVLALLMSLLAGVNSMKIYPSSGPAGVSSHAEGFRDRLANLLNDVKEWGYSLSTKMREYINKNWPKQSTTTAAVPVRVWSDGGVNQEPIIAPQQPVLLRRVVANPVEKQAIIPSFESKPLWRLKKFINGMDMPYELASSGKPEMNPDLYSDMQDIASYIIKHRLDKNAIVPMLRDKALITDAHRNDFRYPKLSPAKQDEIKRQFSGDVVRSFNDVYNKQVSTQAA